MNRRAFLRAGAALTTVGSGALAGCTNLFQVQSGVNEPPLPENRPQTVYYPSHIEGMKMAGMKGMNTNMNGSGSEGGTNASAGMQGMTDQRAGYACALTYSYPHRFWTVTGQKTEKVTIQQEDSIHLMVSVWDRATHRV